MQATITPIIFSAVGSPKSGRNTVLTFLAEALYEDGYRAIKYLEDTELTKRIVSNEPFRNDAKSIKDLPIFFAGKLETEDSVKIFLPYPKHICIHVTHKSNDIKPKWHYHTGKNTLPFTNPDNLRLCRMQVTDLYYNNIQNLQCWKDTYANKH